MKEIMLVVEAQENRNTQVKINRQQEIFQKSLKHQNKLISASSKYEIWDTRQAKCSTTAIDRKVKVGSERRLHKIGEI